MLYVGRAQCLFSNGEIKKHLGIKTTKRLLRCLDQVNIHLPSLQGPDFTIVPNLIALIKGIFTTESYHNYQRESNIGSG